MKNENNPMNRLTPAKGIILALVVVAIIIFATIVWGGIYNVSALKKHSKPVEWVLRTTMENSVKNHAEYIEVPDSLDLTDPKFARQFFAHYDGACVTCHGAPGKKSDPWMVIYPEALNLTDKKAVERWSDAELFWIIKNGIAETGMPALGATHPDEAIWGITAMVKQLPDMSAEEYKAMEEWFKKE